MPSLLEELRNQLDPNTVEGIGQRIGANEQQTGQAISALVPMLIGGLSQNVQTSPQGAQSLNNALERDHDGSLLEQLGGLLGGASGQGSASGMASAAANMLGGGQGGDLLSMLAGMAGGGNARALNADGILGHILGGRRGAVESGVSQATGLNSRQVSQLMGLLAPLVMSTLGKVKRQQKMDADQIADLVNRERRTIEQEVPETQEGSLLSILDSNRDGKVDMKDDVAKVGMALGGAFLLSQRRRG